MNAFLRRKIVWFIAVPLVLIGALALSLPKILNGLGLNRPYPGRAFQLGGKRALIITTSHAVLGDSGQATGVYASEMTVPYYQFLDAGLQVDLASIAGGEIPVEPISLRWPLLTPQDQRFLSDSQAQARLKNSLKIDGLDFSQYDLVYLAGGWGAAYDLGFSDVLGQKISQAYAQNVVLGSVCHGALGFLRATTPDGAPLVKGRRMTAVTNKQVQELGIEITPLHPERELRSAGVLYESATAFRDILASHVVVDGTLVTGQNQNDGAEVAQRMMAMVEHKAAK